MPPEANAACVCAMEDTLEVSHRPYDEHRPMGCCDAGTKPLSRTSASPSPRRLATQSASTTSTSAMAQGICV